MKRLYLILTILCIAFMMAILGCPPDPGPSTPTPTPTPTPVPDFPDEEVTSTYGGSGDEVFHITTTSGDVDLTHTLKLEGSTADVYYVFTNTDPYDDHFNPIVDGKRVPEGQSPVILPEKASTEPYPIFGKPEITKYNSDVSEVIKAGEAMKIPPPDVPMRDTVGDTVTFKYDSSIPTIPATCRSVVTDGTKTLNIYVADDCWTIGGSKTYLVNQTMVDAMADKYLLAGADNDINDWNTTIFGEEWESYAHDTYSKTYIPDYNEITILLYDIDGDDVPTGGYIAGFYWAKDNVYDTVKDHAHSNQRIMFYIDAVVYAIPDGSWDVDDQYPAGMISTLAHEGQHMIHFYQKAIKAGNEGESSETWINEMCSLTAEDFLSRKMQTDGPRGVDWNTQTAGSSGNTNGRLPLFNDTNDFPLTDWLYGSNVLYSYSTAYAYGAYIARNYGGVDLFQDIVQNSDRDYMAVENAISAVGYTDDFSESLQKWGASILLSDNTSPPGSHYEYNTGVWDISSIGGITYDLGSINLYNYYYPNTGQDGPYIYTTSPVGDVKHDEFWSASNRLYLVGTGLSGDVTHEVKMEDGVKLTVVVKE